MHAGHAIDYMVWLLGIAKYVFNGNNQCKLFTALANSLEQEIQSP